MVFLENELAEAGQTSEDEDFANHGKIQVHKNTQGFTQHTRQSMDDQEFQFDDEDSQKQQPIVGLNQDLQGLILWEE